MTNMFLRRAHSSSLHFTDVPFLFPITKWNTTPPPKRREPYQDGRRASVRASQPGGRRRSIAEQAAETAETQKTTSGAPPTSNKRRAERRSSGVYFAPLPAGGEEAKDELYNKASLAFERLRMDSLKFFCAAARYLPEEGEEDKERDESNDDMDGDVEQQETTHMLPPDAVNKSNKVQDKVLRAKEICECLSHLTALDIKPDSGAAKALMK